MDKRHYRRLMLAVVAAIVLFLVAFALLWVQISGSKSVQVNNYIGKSAYQSATEAGFKGTENDWVNSLKPIPAITVKGDKGDTGKNGTDGKQITETHVTTVTLPAPVAKDGKDGKDGTDGKNGREIEIRTNPNTHDKEWRYSGTRGWNVLIAYCEIRDTCGDQQ